MTPLPETPDGSEWSWLVINSSGGKDSAVALLTVVEAADAAGFPRDRIVVSHQILGRIEWEGATEMARSHAAHFGLRFETSIYRDKHGGYPTLLDYVRRRGKWPDSQNRYCTSTFKRDPGGRVLTQLARERPGFILHCFGFRAEESPARRKAEPFKFNLRHSSRSKLVYDWLPVQDLKAEHLWGRYLASGMGVHRAYGLGMPRFSCVFCIFASRDALLVAGREHPDLLDDYCDVEIQTGHKFRQDLSLVELRDALRAGAQPDLVKLKQSWQA